MFALGDLLVYGVHGVCKIIELQVQVVNRKKVEYFVLEPIMHPGSKFFVPSQNEAALAKLRPILSKEQIEEIVASDASRAACWIDDENRRKLYYKELLTSGDRAALISMLRALNAHKVTQVELGKKFHISDANFMHDAEKMLYSEFSLVLQIPYESVEAYIFQ